MVTSTGRTCGVNTAYGAYDRALAANRKTSSTTSGTWSICAGLVSWLHASSTKPANNSPAQARRFFSPSVPFFPSFPPFLPSVPFFSYFPFQTSVPCGEIQRQQSQPLSSTSRSVSILALQIYKLLTCIRPCSSKVQTCVKTCPCKLQNMHPRLRRLRMLNEG